VAAFGAASALAGGVAAAWFYRKTIKKLREAESQGENPESGISDGETEYDN
jgi:membrane associated rhomboid family serine protease